MGYKDFADLMRLLSVPRPNGSAAERETAHALQNWLKQRGILFRVQGFRHYPYYFEAIGLWLVVTRALLAVAVWLRWGWPALAIALLATLGGTLDVALRLPLITWPGATRGENILIEFEPKVHPPAQHLILCAHYDSKTELLDHHRRAFFTTRLRHGMALTLLVGLLGLADGWLRPLAPAWATLAFALGALLTLPLLVLSWGLGLNLSLGRLASPSQGAVDNGAACAILLGLAQSLTQGKAPLAQTRVTVALFTGEEVNMQGSRAYVRTALDSSTGLAVLALNLEIMGQDGDYVLWQRDGDAFRTLPTTQRINQTLAEIVAEVVGRPPQQGLLINSDTFSFLAAGIPAATLGTLDSHLQASGFHRPSDHLGRVAMPRLPQAVEILERFLLRLDGDSYSL